jgi:type VII secretion protein EccB
VQPRRDQVQAQSYVLGRLTSALVAGQPEAPESPNRRLVFSSIMGILLAAVIAAGFGVYGFLSPGGATAWREPGVLVVEKESGSRYVLIDGRLRPVLNFASARLLLGPVPKVVTVAARSLRSVPHGQPVGIVGGPDTLPAVTAIAGTAWTVCALTVRDPAGAQITATTLTVTAAADARGDPLADDRAFVATAKDGGYHLIWRSHRHRLAQPWLSTVLGYIEATPVEAGWLEALPAGGDLGPIGVAGRGEPGPVIDGHPSTIGQLLVTRVAGTPERYYLLQRDGLTPLTQTAYAIAAGDPDTAKAYPNGSVALVEVSAAAVSRVANSKRTWPDAGLPATPPAVASLRSGQTWCVRHDTASQTTTLVAAAPVVAENTVVTGGLGITRTALTAATVDIRAGVGGLVRAGRPDQAPGSNAFLVTDAGVKYPVTANAVKQLGYPVESAAIVSPRLLDLLPTGPVLDPGLLDPGR